MTKLNWHRPQKQREEREDPRRRRLEAVADRLLDPLAPCAAWGVEIGDRKRRGEKPNPVKPTIAVTRRRPSHTISKGKNA